jgi:ArsR family transcriptional regulator, arsenate/arsenite/antimonite-responsive transcriptional repressor
MNDRITETTNIFKALGDPTRLKLMGLMLGTERLCVGMLANKLGITQSAVSQHLKLLKHVELVTCERVGFHMHYSVNMNTIKKYKLDIKTIFGVAAEQGKCVVCPKEIQTKK